MKLIFTIIVGLMLTLPMATATDAQETNPAAADSQSSDASKQTTLEDLGWIVGDWSGNAMGGQFEESWNAPSGGSMMGMFKLVNDNQVVFYELMTILEEDGKLLLRLKHFGNDLKGWEEKDKSVEFPFIKQTDSEIVFDGLKFQKVNDQEMNILVKTKDGDKVQELKFACKRAKTDTAKTDVRKNDTAKTEKPNAKAVFELLKPLVGVWKTVSETGKETRVEYTLSAKGSVLVEHWRMPSGNDSMTLYHLDGESLIATHYCPRANQPRLELVRAGDDGMLEFEFKSATNLHSIDATHQHKFQLRFNGTDTLWRNEDYLTNGNLNPGAADYVRVKD